MPPTERNTNTQDNFKHVVERVKDANNILVTISTNPTVDQFAACIGLTLVLTKLGKHATAVFSGEVPSTIDFLKPEKTLEKNTDSLRDFIIALDKSKADKLRYKVEDNVVKIFITPYKTSINEHDLEYSQGDFNVDAIIGLGVKDKSHLDAAILAHGRILHDATIISVNNSNESQLGSINWLDKRASSLCEMAADIARELSQDVFDSQNATALLTGIVAETDRYSNEKAAPHTMSVAGVLMSAGASTQLVSSKLQDKTEPEKKSFSLKTSKSDDKKSKDGGEITIKHDVEPIDTRLGPESTLPPRAPEPDESIQLSEEGSIPKVEPPRVIKDPPQLGGQLTANSLPEEKQYSGSTDPLSNVTSNMPLLTHEEPAKEEETTPPPPEGLQFDENKFDTLEITDKQKLTDIEKAVDSPHLTQTASEARTEESARDAVEKAELGSEPIVPKPRQDMGAQALSPPPPVPPPFMPGEEPEEPKTTP